MATQPLRQLVTVLRGCIRGGNHTRALRLLATNMPRVGGHYLLRRYAAQILKEMGRTRQAVEIFEMLVRHFTNAGHPLLAIAVAHELSELEPNVGSHFDHLARVYALGSPFIDASQSLKPLEGISNGAQLDLSGAQPEAPLDELAAMVHEMALRKERFVATPDTVAPIPLLSRLDMRTLRTLVEMLRPVRFSDEELVHSPQKPLTGPMWIVSGQVRGQSLEGRRMEVGVGTLLGYRTILEQPPGDEPVACTARESVEGLLLDQDTLPMVRSDVTVQRTVANFDLACLIDRALERSAVFSRIPHLERAAVVERMQARLLDDNTTIIHQGQSSDGLYLVVDGRIDINKRDGEWDVTFKTLAIGEVVGEISLVTDGPAVASVVTDGPTRVLFMSRDQVRTMCDAYPEVLAELRESAAKRLLAQEK